MVRQKPKGGCSHKLENGKKCGRKIDGRGGWLYCSLCRDEAQEEARRKRNKVSNAKKKAAEGFHEDDRRYHLISYYGLTKPHLRDSVANAPSLREFWPEARDDQHKFAFKKLQDIQGRF